MSTSEANGSQQTASPTPPSLLLLSPTRTLLHGLVVGVAFAVAVIVALAIDARLFLEDYPPAIQAVVGDSLGEPPDAVQLVGLLLTFGTLLGGLAWSLWRATRASSSPSWVACFVHSFIVLELLNVVDVVLTDWIVFVALQPTFVVLPGTAGHPAYDDLWFHVEVSFLSPGIYLVLAVSAAVAATVAWALARRRR